MANHRAEEILVAVLAVVNNLTTTSTNVERGRFYPVDEATPAALTISQGAMKPADEPNTAFQYPSLDVVITAHAKGSDDTVESTLNQIAKEVYMAMMENHTLGLPFVHDTVWQGNDTPTLASAEQPMTSMQMHFVVMFQHSYTDPSA